MQHKSTTPHISLELHPIEVDALIIAIVARIEDLEAYRDTVSVSESLVLLDIAKRIQKEVKS